MIYPVSPSKRARNDRNTDAVGYKDVESIDITSSTMLRQLEPPSPIINLLQLRINEGAGDIARFLLLAPATLTHLSLVTLTQFSAQLIPIFAASLTHLSVVHPSANDYSDFLPLCTALVSLSLPGVNLLGISRPLYSLRSTVLRTIRTCWSEAEDELYSCVLGLIWIALKDYLRITRLELDKRFGDLTVIERRCSEKKIELLRF